LLFTHQGLKYFWNKNPLSTNHTLFPLNQLKIPLAASRQPHTYKLFVYFEKDAASPKVLWHV